MMGAAAVAVVVVCAAMYTIFEVIERRKRKKFAEDIRRYIQNHKGEWTSDNQDLPYFFYDEAGRLTFDDGQED